MLFGVVRLLLSRVALCGCLVCVVVFVVCGDVIWFDLPCVRVYWFVGDVICFVVVGFSVFVLRFVVCCGVLDVLRRLCVCRVVLRLVL